MPRYLVERTFQDGVALPGPGEEPQRRDFIDNNSLDGVIWLYSYVASEIRKSFCLYDAPSPEALRRAAQRNNLPVDRIVEVQALNPYLYIKQRNSSHEAG